MCSEVLVGVVSQDFVHHLNDFFVSGTWKITDAFLLLILFQCSFRMMLHYKLIIIPHGLHIIKMCLDHHLFWALREGFCVSFLLLPPGLQTHQSQERQGVFITTTKKKYSHCGSVHLENHSTGMIVLQLASVNTRLG